MSDKHSHNWKGGRVVASNGYILLYRPGHHLADVRGYVYEHRLVAEDILGRDLRKGEIPHHLNEVKTDNRPENIEVIANRSSHRVRHRSAGKRLRYPHEPNKMVTCLCGCGTTFPRFDATGRSRSYVSGHNMAKGPDGKLAPKRLPPEEVLNG